MTQLLAPRQTTVLQAVQATGIEIPKATITIDYPLTDSLGNVIGQETIRASVIISDPNIPSVKRTQLETLATSLAQYAGFIA